METINFLAQLWGFSFIIVGLALLINKKNLAGIIATIEQETLVPIIGVGNVILGVILILFYNTWEQSWVVVVTLLGWLVLIRGLALLFAPEFIKKVIHYIKTNKDTMQLVLLAIIVLGCFLVYAGANF